MRFTKRFFAFLVVAALVLSCLPAVPVSVEAATVVESGTCGNDLIWTLDEEGRFTITGTGPMADYSEADPIWREFSNQIRELVVGEGVTSIGNSAFYECFSLTSITMPDSLTRIGDNAFAFCTGLTSLVIPNGVTKIGYGAFDTCFCLTEVFLGESVTNIDGAAFIGCSSLRSITIPTSVTQILERAFLDCDSLEIVCYGGTQTQWDAMYIDEDGNEALFSAAISFVVEEPAEPELPAEPALEFNYVVRNNEATILGCASSVRGDVIIPDNIGGFPVTAIDQWAFSGRSDLTGITIPESVTSIGAYAFYVCENMTAITIPNSVISIGDCAFGYCRSLESVVIPEGVTSLGDCVFYECNNLTNIVIPEGITRIGESMFAWCVNLTNVVIPEGVISIAENAFLWCSNLTGITIPESVTSIGSWAFDNCGSLMEVYYAGTVEQWDSIAVGEGNGVFDFATIYYEWKESTEPEPTEPELPPEPALEFNYVVRNNEATILGCASSVRGDVIIPDNIGGFPVTAIGAYAFENCTDITSVTVPYGVTSIGMNAFRDCSNLESITLPDSVTIIDSGAFYRCSSLTHIVLPESVTSIGYDAFWYCSSLKSIAIPDSVTSIGTYAFYGCSSLTDVYYNGTQDQWNAITVDGHNDPLLAANIHFVEEEPTEPDGVVASGTCGDDVAWILDDEGVLTISGTGMMEDYYNDPSPWYEISSAVEKVVIQPGVTGIGAYAFYTCGDMMEITIPEGVTTIGEGAFGYCTRLSFVQIPDGVTSIGEYAFTDCTGLGSVDIPNSVTGIGAGAFYNCYVLTGIVIPDGVTDLGNYMFRYCSNLADVTIGKGVTKIGYAAFEGCTNLGSITIPEGVTGIGELAFRDCLGLRSVVISGGVTSIGRRAFYSCVKLEDVYYDGTETQWNEISIETGNENLTNATIYFLQTEPEQNGLYCEHCDQLVEWKTWDGLTFNEGGHYIVPENLAQLTTHAIVKAMEVVLDLNGQTVESTVKAFHVTDGGDLTILDSSAAKTGTVIGKGKGSGTNAGVIQLYQSTSTAEVVKLTILGGTYRLKEGSQAKNGGVIHANKTCEVVVKNATIEGGTAALGAAIYVNGNVKLTVGEGAVIKAGKASTYGDTIYVTDATPRIVIEDNAWIEGGIYATSTAAGVITVQGAPVIQKVEGGSAYSFKGSALNVGQLQEGASIGITKAEDGAFTTEFADQAAAEAAMAFFTADEETKQIKVEDRVLVIAEKTEAPAEPAVAPGDMNGDGMITDADALHLLRYVLFPDLYPINQDGDMNGDGMVTDADALHLLRYVLFPDLYPLYPNK